MGGREGEIKEERESDMFKVLGVGEKHRKRKREIKGIVREK
jgi:hypothetical protein